MQLASVPSTNVYREGSLQVQSLHARNPCCFDVFACPCQTKHPPCPVYLERHVGGKQVFMKGGAKDLEDQLLKLNQEQAMLGHEVSKSLASAQSRTLVERSRRHQAEARLQTISRDITQVRQELRRLAGEVGP
jgi:hypothetical protein